jgi:hypothetical protein
LTPTAAELERVRELLAPLVAGARAAVAPGHPDPRRLLVAVEADLWPGLSAEDRRLLLWHGIGGVLAELCTPAPPPPAAH